MREYRSNERGDRRGKSGFSSEERRIRLMIQVVVIVCILIAAFLFMKPLLGKGEENDGSHLSSNETLTEAVALETPEERKITGDIKIDHISIRGLTKEEAAEKLLHTYVWKLKLSHGQQTELLANPLPQKIEALVERIFSETGGKGNDVYELDLSGIEGDIKSQVSQIASGWNKKPVNGQLTGWDKERKQWIYSDGENGVEINEEKAVQDIMTAVNHKNFDEAVEAEARQTTPQLSAARAKEEYQVIGTFHTVATSNQNRNNNIQLAMNALDGLVINPDEEFSFNRTTGNRTIERGYQPAGAYRNGEFVEEPGGGVCQVSSTLYNAIIFAGIETTERNPHSFEPSYVTPGEDSMVSYDGYSGPDLRFVNKQDTSVAFRAVFEDKKLTISVIGRPILEEGVKVSMRSEKVKESDLPEPKYEEDQTLLPDQEVEVKKGVKGTAWKTYLVTTKDGEVIRDEYFHTSTYRGKAGIVKRNTSGVVIPAETAPPETTESNPAVPESLEPATPEPSAPQLTAPGTPELEPEPVMPESSAPNPTTPGTSESEQEPVMPESSVPKPTTSGTSESEPVMPESSAPKPTAPGTSEPEPAMSESSAP